ncbi:hypothetical protein R1sor_006667 [Riccia sorocarpa]|uniref:Histone-lysine N-methyltransferase SUVR4 n=1 Tax=Riccia sorocarpa TaxID=122646 RepID=A0ABD3HQ06_9MARC
MSRTPNKREAKAYEAMEVLGLNRSFIKPILKELLKVYANEWDYIEAENYRLLADQAFEQQENIVKQESTSSPRRTRASTSGTDKGKKKIDYGNTRSAGTNPPKPVAIAAVSVRPLPAWVKLEEDPDDTPQTLPRTPVSEKVDTCEKPPTSETNLPKTPVAERLENRSARDDVDAVKSNGARIDRRGAGSPAKIDARTLQETLRQVTSSYTPSDTAEPSGSLPELSLPDEKTKSLENGDHKVEGNVDKLATVSTQATHIEVLEASIIDTVEGSKAEEPSVSEKGIASTSGPDSVLEEQLSHANGVAEEPQRQSPAIGGADVLSLLADSYSEDKDEPKVAGIAAPDPPAVQTSVKGQEDVELAEVREPHSVVKPPTEESQDQLLVSSNVAMAEEEPLELVLPEEDTEQLDLTESEVGPESGLRTADLIRPSFLVNKELLGTADGDAKVASGLIVLESTTPTGKRELSDPAETAQPKRVKFEETLASHSAVPSMGLNRRKLILSDSPSAEASPLADAEATPFADGLYEPVRPEGRATPGGMMDMASVASAAPNSGRPKRRLSSRNSNASGSGAAVPNGACATVSNIVREPEDLDDEEQVVRKKSAHSPFDISRGTESVKIPFVNEFSSDVISSSFKYIRVNTVFQDAYVNFSLARVGEEDSCGECTGDCLEATFPCACTRETGGVFAYTRDGSLKGEFLQYEMDRAQDEEKQIAFCASGWHCPIERSKNPNDPESCKGHVSRKFIKECWHKCGCSMGCGNRVVQRGITRKLQIFFTHEGKGWGLRTLEQLPAGAFVCEYVGEILTNMEQEERNNNAKADPTVTHTYPILLDGDWCSEKGLKDEEALCLDATFFGNAARFINHRCCDGNLVDVPVTIESPDRHYYHVAFFTSRAVKPMEELTWDYRIDFDDDTHPIEAFKCLCGSPFCRGASSSKKRKKRGRK